MCPICVCCKLWFRKSGYEISTSSFQDLFFPYSNHQCVLSLMYILGDQWLGRSELIFSRIWKEEQTKVLPSNILRQPGNSLLKYCQMLLVCSKYGNIFIMKMEKIFEGTGRVFRSVQQKPSLVSMTRAVPGYDYHGINLDTNSFHYVPGFCFSFHEREDSQL